MTVRASILARVRHILARLPGGRIVENGEPVLFHPFFRLANEMRAAKGWIVLSILSALVLERFRYCEVDPLWQS